MNTGDWALVGFLIIAVIAIGGVWIATRPETEDPPGIDIVHIGRFDWSYVADDPQVQRGIGYVTRASAVRAARGALQELEESQSS